MSTDLTDDMFAGNFIRELPRVRVTAKGRPNGQLRRYVLLRCLQCGAEFSCLLSSARRIKQKCCSHRCAGEYREGVPGGNQSSPLYFRWLSMRQRVYNVDHPNYPNYGARGITIEDGLEDFTTYVEYVTRLPGYDPDCLDKLQLDRKDNNGNYAKGNLRWANRPTQIANQRPNSRGQNRYTGVSWSKSHDRWVARVVFDGKVYCSSTHLTQEEALEARNQCIRANNLPHPIQTFTG